MQYESLFSERTDGHTDEYTDGHTDGHTDGQDASNFRFS
jgi:hypothetical protein